MCAGLEFLAEALPQIPVPPAMPADWRVLVETADAAGAGVGARLEAALAGALAEGLVEDALIAQNDGQRAVFWGVRETIPEANRLIGSVSSHDISLPPSRLAEFVARAARRSPRSPRSFASTASATSATATCTTTSSRRPAAAATPTTRCAGR